MLGEHGYSPIYLPIMAASDPKPWISYPMWAVWPNVKIKSSQSFFQKLPKKQPHQFDLKSDGITTAPKATKHLGYFCKKNAKYGHSGCEQCQYRWCSLRWNYHTSLKVQTTWTRSISGMNDPYPFSTNFPQPWSSGYGRILMFQRSQVWIQAPYTGWTFFTYICVLNL